MLSSLHRKSVQLFRLLLLTAGKTSALNKMNAGCSTWFHFPWHQTTYLACFLRFLDTTVTAAASLSVCETLLSILNPSHRAQQELWAPKRTWNRSDRIRAAFYSSWELKQHCVRALGAQRARSADRFVLSPPQQGLAARLGSARPGAEAALSAAAGAAAHGHHTTPLVLQSNTDHMVRNSFSLPFLARPPKASCASYTFSSSSPFDTQTYSLVK